MEDLLNCGHPTAAYVDRPAWGWCSVCAQQAEAALPEAKPSRLVPEGAHAMPDLSERCWGCGAGVASPLIRLVCDACAAAPTWATVAPLLERWQIALVPAAPGLWTLTSGWPSARGLPRYAQRRVPFDALPQAIQDVAQRCEQEEETRR